MGGFRSWLANFMQGRYGYDALGRSMSIWIIILIAASIVLSVAARIFATFGGTAVAVGLNIASTVVNWASIIMLVLTIARMLSRNRDKRREENERYLSRRAKGGKKQQNLAREQSGYTYLTCQFCNQKMRVPKGRGKIAVKCPACGEKTIVNS